QVAWMHSPGRVTRGLQSFPLVADGVLYYTGPYSRVFALDAATGQVIWSFIPKLDEDLIAAQTHTPYTRGIALGHGHLHGGTPEAQKTWGNESWRVGGGGGWMPGAYNSEKNLVYWGIANPAPLFDWAGDNWQTDGARPGDNLYTSSMIALDPDTGQLKSYF